jgi:hypothetical protein
LAGTDGVITSTVERGDEPVEAVWAAVYAPSFQEPNQTSLQLGVPLIELQPDEEQEGTYSAYYEGFNESGIYRVVIYAEDRTGNQSQPLMVQTEQHQAYLPLMLRPWP